MKSVRSALFLALFVVAKSETAPHLRGRTLGSSCPATQPNAGDSCDGDQQCGCGGEWIPTINPNNGNCSGPHTCEHSTVCACTPANIDEQWWGCVTVTDTTGCPNGGGRACTQCQPQNVDAVRSVETLSDVFTWLWCLVSACQSVDDETLFPHNPENHFKMAAKCSASHPFLCHDLNQLLWLSLLRTRVAAGAVVAHPTVV